MGDFLTPLDLVIFFALLIFAMAVGLIAGRKEETSEDYFLAGRKIPWWGVAGSIFGSNVSANHMVGMMGIGFSIGFAQSHFELGAIFGLLLLCYGFLPVYRKLNLYTLSEYLGRRYDDRSRISYALIMVVIMAMVHLVPALYIGSRSICVLIGATSETADEIDSGEKPAAKSQPAESQSPENARESGAKAEPKRNIEINKTYYGVFVIALALVSASYTIFGGLKAVVWTDVIQSVLLLIAGIVVAILIFQAVGGWNAMMARDQGPGGADKMHLYLPMNHDQLPWTGVFTGLMFMHCFYWGTNQFIVQRALGARSDREARLGIITAGYLKLLIPFFAIAAGVAAVYVFRDQRPDTHIAPDTAFTEIVKLLVAPLGFGLVGVIAAGLIGAILSSIDSMMNSAATIVTVDIYKRYIKPDATDREMIFVGRLSIVVFVVVAALMAIFVLDPNSKKNFFLQIANYQNYLTPGILVAFLLGMFWKRGTATAAFVTILAGVVFSAGVQFGYDKTLGNEYLAQNTAVYRVVAGQIPLDALQPDQIPGNMKQMTPGEREAYIAQQRAELSPVALHLGPSLNFFHRVVGVIALCVLVYIAVSLCGTADPKRGLLTWTDLGGHDQHALRNVVLAILVSICIFAVLGWLMVNESISSTVAAVVGAVWAASMFLGAMLLSRRAGESREAMSLWRDDRLYASILCGCAVFMLFYFA